MRAPKPNFRWMALAFGLVLIASSCTGVPNPLAPAGAVVSATRTASAVASPTAEATALAAETATPAISATTVVTETSGPTPTAAMDMSSMAAATAMPAGTLSPTPTPTMDMSAMGAATGAEPAVTGQGVLYQDDFTNPKSGWPDNLQFGNYYVGYHEPNHYHVDVDAPHDRAVVVAPQQSFSDFTVETQVQAEPNNTDKSGDFRFGLVFRRSGNDYYAFAVSPRTKTWTVLKSSSTGQTELAKGSNDSIQGLTAPDALRVDAKGPTFSFYINGQVVGQASDADYARGEVGFYVETFDSPRVHAHYGTITVRQVEAAPPATHVLYQDDFTNPNSGWPDNLEFGNYLVGYHEPNHYHVDVHAPHDRAVVTAPQQSFSDFTVETQVQAEPNNTDKTGDFRFGLVFRRSGNDYYAFAVSPRTKTWTVLKSSPSGLTELAKGSNDSIQGLTAPDALRVDAQGPTFSFYINDQAVGQASDSDYASGEVGFYVETFDSPRVHAHYGTITVRELVAAAPARHVLYQDDFTDPKSGWPDNLQFGSYYIGYHEPNHYHVDVHAPHDRAVVAVPQRSFSDFTVEVPVQAEPNNTDKSGDFRFGLVFRRSGNNYYAFAVSPRTKTWTVLKSSPGGLTELAKGSNDSIQGLTAPDTLRVDAKGSTFSFYINDQAVGQVSDADYTSGEVGFYVETFDSPRVHAHYGTITVREVEPLPPAEHVLYQDDFTNPNSGWPDNVEFENYSIRYHHPDHYHIEVHTPHDRAVVAAPNQSFTDFTIESQTFPEQNNSDITGDFRYGLVFRRSGNQYYAFAVSPLTKTWAVLKSSPSGLTELAKGSSDSIQGFMAADTLRVDVKGPTFFFHINDQTVGQVSDSDYASGEVGFYVETLDSSRVHVQYWNIIVREVEAPQLACTVTTPALRLRLAPGITYGTIAYLSNGDRLEPLGRTPDGQWIDVRPEGSDQTGWVANAPELVTCNMSVNDLPLAR